MRLRDAKAVDKPNAMYMTRLERACRNCQQVISPVQVLPSLDVPCGEVSRWRSIPCGSQLETPHNRPRSMLPTGHTVIDTCRRDRGPAMSRKTWGCNAGNFTTGKCWVLTSSLLLSTTHHSTRSEQFRRGARNNNSQHLDLYINQTDTLPSSAFVLSATNAPGLLGPNQPLTSPALLLLPIFDFRR